MFGVDEVDALLILAKNPVTEGSVYRSTDGVTSVYLDCRIALIPPQKGQYVDGTFLRLPHVVLHPRIMYGIL